MKLFVSILASLFAASAARAQVVVVDPAAIAHNQANHAVDLANTSRWFATRSPR